MRDRDRGRGRAVAVGRRPVPLLRRRCGATIIEEGGRLSEQERFAHRRFHQRDISRASQNARGTWETIPTWGGRITVQKSAHQSGAVGRHVFHTVIFKPPLSSPPVLCAKRYQSPSYEGGPEKKSNASGEEGSRSDSFSAIGRASRRRGRRVDGSRIGFCARRSPRESRQLWRLLERRPTRGGHEPINTQQKTQEALYERHGASEVHVLQEGCLGSGASLAEQGEESGGGGVKDVRKSRARLERPANLLLQVSSATTSFASRSLFLATTVSRLADLVLPFAFLL